MGYHPGFEDDGIYLAAIKALLHPALYPQNGAFFRLQMQASIFDRLIAGSVRWTQIPLIWSELLWQFAALFFILFASKRIAGHLFREVYAQWAAVTMVAAMFTLPVAGTALNIADQHLHPRNLATALVLSAVAILMDTRTQNRLGIRWLIAPLLVLALAIHPIMGAFGISFCVFLSVALKQPIAPRTRAPLQVAAAAPLSWLFAPETPAWRQALASRAYYSVYRWHWYEWLGAIAPIVLFALLDRSLRTRAHVDEDSADATLARFSRAVFLYGAFQLAAALLLQAPSSLARLMTLQPMRFLQLIYLAMALVGGGLLGRFVVRAKLWRWAIYLLLINGSMFLVQWETIDQGTHLELPFSAVTNPWLQAFAWVRQNTPNDAYFALDPQYLATPGEGVHNFRALAERSALSDGVKDTAVAMEVPSLAPLWAEQQAALAGWPQFQLSDFERLKAQYGVNWALVAENQTAGLDCRWHNAVVSVCRIP